MDGLKKFFGDLADKVNAFMADKNGFDDLGYAVIWIVVILDCIFMVTEVQVFHVLYLIGFAYWIFRVFSKNVEKRRAENLVYRKWINGIKARLTQNKDYMFFTCSKCGANVRVPRRRGRVEVTCPECGEKRIVETGEKKK